MDDASPSLSVLFADVSGSARLHEKLGEPEALRAVDRCLKRMERAVDGFGGRIIKTVGDEMMAVFELADEALQAAVEMQQRVADLPPVSGVQLAIRVGFSHGPVTKEEGSVVGETVDLAARLAGMAKPGQVLTSLQARSALSPALKRATRSVASAVDQEKHPGLEVFEVIPPDSGPPAVKAADSPVLENTPLRLRYSGKVITLDDNRPVIHMGRDVESDVLIHDRRASRHHAQIEWRGDKIFLVDNSTNGTFVTLSGKPELFLRRQECVLYGKGVICFAASASSPDADCAEFEQG